MPRSSGVSGALVTCHDARGCHHFCFSHVKERLGHSFLFGHSPDCPYWRPEHRLSTGLKHPAAEHAPLRTRPVPLVVRAALPGETPTGELAIETRCRVSHWTWPADAELAAVLVLLVVEARGPYRTRSLRTGMVLEAGQRIRVRAPAECDLVVFLDELEALP